METHSLSQTTRLIRRNGIYHYRRRVPDDLVAAIGRREIHRSLGTASLTEAKKLRTMEDLKWDARFHAAGGQAAEPSAQHKQGEPVSRHEALRLVQQFVARMDENDEQDILANPPADECERSEMWENIGIGLTILKDRDDPRADELVDHAILQLTANEGPVASANIGFAEIVRRGLLELHRRQLARLEDNHGGLVFDNAFAPGRPAETSFGLMATQFLELTREEARANRTNQKWVDKQKSNVALLTEIVGEGTPIRQVDYDACLRVRSVLARLPANRSKLYDGLSIEQSIAAGEAAGKPGLSSATQNVYLSTLNAILELGLRKGLVPVNPAQGLKPLKKETLAASARRLPFTGEQLKAFFEGKFYRTCGQHSPAWAHDKQGWRFWLPPLCLFMGMRPNEVCQMEAADVRRTDKGTWYLDVVAAEDEDEESAEFQKTLKTATSRRRIPIHPELLAIGFLDFVETRRTAGQQRLFPDLKPDQYGNCAKYAMRRFRETFLPAEITLEPRQTFYSFRHNFRDALRAVGAPPDALQALGGWSQGKLTSDDYGDKSNPDFQAQYITKVEYQSVSLAHLRAAIP
jgi:integrase